MARAQEYPWQEWGDGSIWKIQRGEDFAVTRDSMRAMLYNRAKTLGEKVRVVLRGDTVYFQFTSPE